MNAAAGGSLDGSFGTDDGGDRPVAASPGFDLLVIDEADSLTEAELVRLAGHAPRVLLVGQPSSDAPGSAATNGPVSPTGQASLSTSNAWARLWHAVADDLSSLPYVWQQEAQRLVCHLATVRPEDERHLEREGLADATEIDGHRLPPALRAELGDILTDVRREVHAATAMTMPYDSNAIAPHDRYASNVHRRTPTRSISNAAVGASCCCRGIS